MELGEKFYRRKKHDFNMRHEFELCEYLALWIFYLNKKDCILHS